MNKEVEKRIKDREAQLKRINRRIRRTEKKEKALNEMVYSKNVRIYVIGTFILVVLCACTRNVILFGLSLLLFFVYLFWVLVNMSKGLKELGDNYDANTNTLNVSKTSPVLKNFLKIVEARDIITKYEEEKTHFGAVTVGGVTTGGTYKTGGYFYNGVGEKNGYYLLLYHGSPVCRVEFTNEEVIQKCKKSNAGSHLYGNSIQIYDPEVAKYSPHMPPSKESSSYKKCKDVLDFLCEKM